MSRARNLADLLNASGKIKSSKLDAASVANDSLDSQHYAAGSIDLEHLSSQSVDEDNLYVSNAGTDGQYLQKQSGNDGGLTWGTVDLTTLSATNLTSGIVPTARINAGSIANDLLDSQHYAAGSIDLEHLSSESVDEDNLYVSNAGSNGQYLQKQSGNAGGLTWGTVDLTALSGANLTSGIIPTARINASSIANDLITTQHIADSVALGGSPTTTTQSAADNSTKVATTAYADAAVAALADSAPSTLNTLNELAAALGDDANYAATTTAAIGLKAPIASPTFTGDIGMPNGSIDLAMMNANSVDSDQYVDGSIDLAHMSSQSVDEDNLYISNAGTNGQYLQKQSGNDGGLTWATVDTSLLLPKAGGTMTGNTLHGDNVKDTYGASADLEIYHDGSHSYIKDSGTGDLMLRGTNIRIKSGVDNDDMATFIENGAANLYYSNVKKIETTAAGAYVTGDFTASGNVTAYSDERLKSSVETIPDALSKVLNVRGVTFDMNAERGTGVIAQELEKVLPEAVFDNEDGMKSVAYGNVVGLLIEAIKEQQVQIETLMDMVGE